MQYPQIQFYKGSLVRLASGQLKQVEDLSSDDFVESARLASSTSALSSEQQLLSSQTSAGNTLSRSTLLLANTCNNQNHNQHHQHQHQNNRNRFDFNPIARDHLRHYSHNDGPSRTLDENNNSVFNSPEPTSAGYDDSPRMDTDDYNDTNNDEDIDVELDVVTHDDHQRHYADDKHQVGLNLSSQNGCMNNVHNMNGLANLSTPKQSLVNTSSTSNNNSQLVDIINDDQQNCDLGEFYIDSSVVRDFLEVGPIHQHQQQTSATNNVQQQQQQNHSQSPSSTSPASSTGSLTNHDPHLIYSLPSTSVSATSSSSSSLHQVSISPPVIMPQISSTATAATASQTVLIKFFLETSRSVAFIEVPIEHPFFVFHRGWSSWNPQKTYDKFGLKCRKLKIGDTCVSLIRRRRRQAGNNPNNLHESDQCNILFSSIKIHE